jgi:hypothetical protein
MGLGCAKTSWWSNNALPLAIQVRSGPVLVEDGPNLGGDYDRHRRHEWSDTDDVRDAREIVGQNMKGHLRIIFAL